MSFKFLINLKCWFLEKYISFNLSLLYAIVDLTGKVVKSWSQFLVLPWGTSLPIKFPIYNVDLGSGGLENKLYFG